MRSTVARLWRALGGELQWRALYYRHAKFMVGVTAVCWTADGRVLLARHRYWPERTPWGLPSGYAQRGEQADETIRREVLEEVGVHLDEIRLADLRTGFRFRVEVCLDAQVADESAPTPDGREVLEAAFFAPDALPIGVLPRHLDLIRASLDRRAERAT